jgi:sterol desaturase/sphingolipid hydroxylase (fatty acid hydroxylase superfamily)
VVEGLIWPFAPALGRAPPVCIALEWITIERLTPELVATADVVPRSAAESPGASAICAKLAFEPEEAVMLQTVSRLLPEFPLFFMTAVATHLIISFGQTLMHYKLGHRPIGGKLFRNHINFHHTYYSKDHLVSRTYLGDEGNNTPFFFIPVFLVGTCTSLLLPFDLFVVQVVACAASFYAHVFFDKEYHVEGSRLQRFAWFRRKQELHFVHHRHANCNFAVIHFFWDRILCTYRKPAGDGAARQKPLN